MNQDNYGQNYSYDHYERASPRRGIIEKVFGPGIAAKVSNPLFATAALLVVGAAFAGLIVASYPDSEDGEIPVVRADTFAYKETPADPGGMEILNRDTTVFSAMNDSQTSEAPPLENLLADEDPQTIETFSRQVEAATAEEGGEEPFAMKRIAKAPEVPETAEIEQTPELTIEEKIIQETASAPPPPEPAKPRIVHKAGESPETLEFVRSVLDKKDGIPPKETVASAAPAPAAAVVARIEPASGNPTISPGEYYVQLASVPSETGALTEWKKLQGAYGGLLSGVDHRFKTADLGERGTFYRIQAGPMSRDSASALCDAIKAQKPGGCLVTR